MTPTLLPTYREARGRFYVARDLLYAAYGAGEAEQAHIAQDALTRAMAARIAAETAVAEAWLAEHPGTEALFLKSGDVDERVRLGLMERAAGRTRWTDHGLDVRTCVIAHVVRRGQELPDFRTLRVTPEPRHMTPEDVRAMYASVHLKPKP